MDVKLDKWHKCHVDKEILKELSKKSDLKGIQHISVFLTKKKGRYKNIPALI